MERDDTATVAPGAVAPEADRPEVERVMTASVFAIATGQWAPGDPVPSVRRGAERWSVSPATVHQAYRLLAERGVLRSESRRGYFVRDGSTVDHLLEHSEALNELYEQVRSLVQGRPELSPVGAFRHMLHQAEREARTRPECAFAECTMVQARLHADEIEARLGIPTLALDLDALDPEEWRPPPGLRVVLTTPFHAEELRPVEELGGVRVVSVPLATSAHEVHALSAGMSRIEIRSVNPEQGRLVAADIRRLLGRPTPRIVVEPCEPARLEEELAATLGSADEPMPGVAVVLSMYFWQALPEPWRRTGAVHPYPYRIDPESWAWIAAAIGVPLAT